MIRYLTRKPNTKPSQFFWFVVVGVLGRRTTNADAISDCPHRRHCPFWYSSTYVSICAHNHVPVISHFLGNKDGSNTFRFLSESLPFRPLSIVSNSDSQPIPFCLVHDSVRSAATFTCPCIASFDDCGYRMSEWFSSEAQSINSGEAVVELPNWSIWLWTEDPSDRIAVVPAALWNHAHWYVHPTHRAVWWNSRRDNDPRCHFFPASRLCSPFTSIFVHIRHPYESMVQP